MPSDTPTVVRAAAGAGFADRLGHAEIRHQGMATLEHDVVGLDVAVDDLVRVRIGQRVDDVAKQPHRLGRRHGADLLDARAERIALDEGHDVVQQAAGLARVVEREDVRVAELGGDLDFAQEPLGAQDGREIGAQDLDRDLAMMLEVVGQVDRGHPSAANFLEDGIAGRQARCAAVRERLSGPGPGKGVANIH